MTSSGCPSGKPNPKLPKLTHASPPPSQVSFEALAHRVVVPVQDVSITDSGQVLLGLLRKLGGGGGAPKKNLDVLHPVSGVLLAGTSTLVLGNPGSGKTTLLKALAAREVTTGGAVVRYNGASTADLSAAGVNTGKLIAYAPQDDTHEPLLTVRETFDFAAASCLAAVGTAVLNVQTVIDVLGLAECENVVIGNDMTRGISGGQKKRVTIGEALLSGSRVLALDQITDGLDAATAEEICRFVIGWAHTTGGTVIAALQAPTPEIFHAFDDCMLMSDGHVLFHGPPSALQAHLSSVGFVCPDTQDVADFALTVATSPLYAAQVAAELASVESTAVTPTMLTRDALAAHWVAGKGVKAPPSPATGGVTLEGPLAKAQWGVAHVHSSARHTALLVSRQNKVVLRNPAVSFGRVMQFCILASIFGSVYFKIAPDAFVVKFSSAIFAASAIAFAGFAEVPAIFASKRVAARQIAGAMYPPLSFTTSIFAAAAPVNFISTFLFGTIFYWMTGWAEDTGRYFFFLAALISMEMAVSSLFRLYAFLLPNEELAQVAAGSTTGVSLIFGGFYIAYNKLPNFTWPLYYLSPFSWCVRSMVNSEFTSTAFQVPVAPPFVMTAKGDLYLSIFGFQESLAWKWGGVAVLLCYWCLFGPILSTLVVKYRKLPSTPGAQRISDAAFVAAATAAAVNSAVSPVSTPAAGTPPVAAGSITVASPLELAATTPSSSTLPFVPLTLTFTDVTYCVTLKGGVQKQLLRSVSGFATPGTMTALMGASGAGKTTLMDVLAFRKTAGAIGGTIKLNGLSVTASGFNAVAAYCEQDDVHMDFMSVKEALEISAALRLSAEVTPAARAAFVADVMRLLELDPIADRRTGALAQGERKRLTIGVELVSNPSVLFLDEPTTGLDARSAAAVMRVIRNVASTGRTVVATIHQPSTAVFFAFDSLLLLSPGGHQAFFGSLGKRASSLLSYLLAIPGVAPPRLNSNPATWALETTGVGNSSTTGTESRKADAVADAEAAVPSLDFVAAYAASPLRASNAAATDALLAATYANPLGVQPPRISFATAFLLLYKRQLLFTWRNTAWTVVKLFIYAFLAIFFGLVYLKVDDSDQQGILSKTAIALNGMLFIAIISMNTGIPNWGRVRRVYYRERAARYYNGTAFALSVAYSEVPFAAFFSLLYLSVNYFMVGFNASASSFFTAYLATFLAPLWLSWIGLGMVGFFPVTLLAQIFAGVLINISIL